MEKRIRRARRSKGLTLKQLGGILGISESAVSNIERGRNKPSGSTLILLCEKLGMNQTWLETGEGEMFVSEKEATDLQPNARFKAIREHYGLSMGAFGQEIGLSASGVSAIEYGTRNMSEKHIKLICAAFPEVSEDWLRTGEGEMLLPQDESAKADPMRYNPNETDRAAIRAFFRALGERCASVPDGENCPRCDMRIFCYAAPPDKESMVDQVIKYLEVRD